MTPILAHEVLWFFDLTPIGTASWFATVLAILASLVAHSGWHKPWPEVPILLKSFSFVPLLTYGVARWFCLLGTLAGQRQLASGIWTRFYDSEELLGGYILLGFSAALMLRGLRLSSQPRERFVYLAGLVLTLGLTVNEWSYLQTDFLRHHH